MEVYNISVVLRFPLRKRLTLITTVGVIDCEVIRATKDFLFCSNVLYDNYELGNGYIDRNSVVAFSDCPTAENGKLEEKIDNKIQQARIHNFNFMRGKIGNNV